MANSCQVLQKFLINDVRSHGRNGHAYTDGDQCSSCCSSISISARGCYNFVFKELINLSILYTQICKRKCNITTLIFFKGSECWGRGLISMEFQCKHSTPTLKEGLSLDKYSILKIHNFFV